jgi:hypothetical protein
LFLEPQGGGRLQECLKLLVAALRRGQCAVGWWRCDELDARESVGDNVVLSRDILYVGGELDEKV